MNEQVVCEVCGISVEFNKYEMHKRFGHNEKAKEDNKCNICDKTFTSKFPSPQIIIIRRLIKSC